MSQPLNRLYGEPNLLQIDAWYESDDYFQIQIFIGLKTSTQMINHINLFKEQNTRINFSIKDLRHTLNTFPTFFVKQLKKIYWHIKCL